MDVGRVMFGGCMAVEDVGDLGLMVTQLLLLRVLLLSIGKREPRQYKDGQGQEDFASTLVSDEPSFARRPSQHIGDGNVVGGWGVGAKRKDRDFLVITSKAGGWTSW